MQIKRVTKLELKQTKKIINTCYVVIDKKHVFFDINNDVRIFIDEYTSIETEQDRKSYVPTEPDLEKIFYIEETNKLYKYDNKWVRIFSFNHTKEGDSSKMIKSPVKVATTKCLFSDYDVAEQTITVYGFGSLSIDGIEINPKDRVLVKDQENKTENGIYIVLLQDDENGRITLKRDEDFKNSNDIENNLLVSSMQGEKYKDILFQLITDSEIILDETPLTFEPVFYRDLDEEDLYIFDTLEKFEDKKPELTPYSNDITLILCDEDYFLGVTCYIYNGNDWIFKRILSVGMQGVAGKDAYEIAQEELGFAGTKSEWLQSLRGIDGDAGVDGKNNYELALEDGFTGTLHDFLESLKGDKGKDGEDGKSAYQTWLDKGHTGTENDFLEWLKSYSKVHLELLQKQIKILNNRVKTLIKEIDDLKPVAILNIEIQGPDTIALRQTTEEKIAEMANQIKTLMKEINKLKPISILSIDINGPSIVTLPLSVSGLIIQGPDTIQMKAGCPCCGCINYQQKK